MKNMLLDSSLVQQQYTTSFICSRPCKKPVFANQYLDQLGDWHFMLEQNLTTFAEVKEKTRSDCHAWSASHFITFWPQFVE